MRRFRLLALIFLALIPSLLAQSTREAKNDLPLSSNSSLPVASAGTSSASKASADKSATGLSSLPPNAQVPISAALGKDDTGYWVHPSAKGFRGENPRQALLAEFTRQGAELRSHNLRWGLETRGYGYGNALHPVKAVVPQAKANRVEYQRDRLTEWYENGPLGLEQGFTLAHPPGKRNGQALTVELGLRGDLVAVLDPGGKALELRAKDGKATLRYAGLSASDATGRELRSWLELKGNRLLVRVEDGAAKYPVVVDPWIQQAELTASDGADFDRFGYSVAVSGSTAVVGAPYHVAWQGAAYVFVESGGTWSQQAELTASDGVELDYFGYSVAISGGTAVVGAYCHPNSDENCGPGAAYVFVQSGTTWSQQAELTASDGAAGNYFGNSVAVSGTTVVVGALFYPGSWPFHVGPGAAYVFAESGGTWSQQAELTASDGEASDYFGISVAVSGSTAVVGAPNHQVGSNQYQGAAYVFVQSGGTWSQQAELTATDGAAEDTLGSSVALVGNTALVGAPAYPPGHGSGEPGSAYVFVESGGTWSQQAELTPPDSWAQDGFGISVAVSGSTAVVGQYQPGPVAYVFGESGGTWGQQQQLAPPDGMPADGFGQSVAASGSTVIVGSPYHPYSTSIGPGAAYVFGSSGPLYTLPASPSSLSVVQGGQGTSTITITPWNGFSGSVSFSASGLPKGVKAAFNPNPSTSTTTMTLTATRGAWTGKATVLVIGVSGNLTQTTMLPLTVIPGPVVKLSPPSLSFGNQAVNIASSPKTVTLKNVGTAALNISDVAFTLGTNFAISSNTCGSTLAAEGTCTASVTFVPEQLGAVTDTLNFTDNASGSPQTVSLTGTGEAQATLTPTSYTFPKTKVGGTSAARNFTLKNNLPTTLTGISYSTAGPFAVSASTCGTALNSKESCTISVTFSPTEAGTATGTLNVSDSANNSPQTASLSGTGD